MERIPAGKFVAGCAVAGSSAVAAAAFLRRIAGEPLRDLPAGEAAAYAAAFSLVVGVGLRSLLGGRGPRVERLGDASALVLAGIFTAGLTAQAISVLCCLFASAATIAMASFGLRSQQAEAAGRVSGGSHDAADTAGGADYKRFAPSPDDAVSRPEGAQARFVRATLEGREVIDGVMRFEIPPGETVQVLHVPVWPPLAAEPAVTCELEGIEGRVRVPAAKTHGFRIEVRVPEAIDEPLAGTVRFVAECPKAAA